MRLTLLQRKATYSLAAVVILAATFVPTMEVQAQVYTVIYNFTGGTGNAGQPHGSLIADTVGNLYGTTPYSGDLNCPGSNGIGCGVVFRLDSAGRGTTIYEFSGAADGAWPLPLIRDKHNLYGTTARGGNLGACHDGVQGCGVVFKIDQAGVETVLYSFGKGLDGAYPFGVVRDPQGNLYGVAASGGSYGLGVLFKVDPKGNETVLHSFNGMDGSGPFGAAPLLRGPGGNLYGTTSSGGTSDKGVVFKVELTSGHYSILHQFSGMDGEAPVGRLTGDALGNLYGVTENGGAFGGGVAFKLDRFGRLAVLHSFCDPAINCLDGAFPDGGLVRDSNGNLYGNTGLGGGCGPNCVGGVLFELDSAGNETVLHDFGNDPGAGWDPQDGLLIDPKGNLYGTTFNGGTHEQGVVFRLTP